MGANTIKPLLDFNDKEDLHAGTRFTCLLTRWCAKVSVEYYSIKLRSCFLVIFYLGQRKRERQGEGEGIL